MSGDGGGNQTVTQVPSAQQDQAFQFRMNQAQAGIGNLEGGAGYFTNPHNNPYVMTPGMQQASQHVYDVAGNTPPDPLDNWAMQGYAPAAQQYWGSATAGIPTMGQWNQGATGLANALMQNSPATMNGWQQGATLGANRAMAPIETGSLNTSAGNINYHADPSTYDPVSVGSQAPVNTRQIDPTAAISSARDTLSVISSPEIRNALQVSGLGRSGAEAEGLAREGTRLELPIQQQILQSQAQANQLDASIKARQEEVGLLQEQQAKLQAQQLTATSAEQAKQINAQIAEIQGQINSHLAEVQFNGQIQAAIAQRTSELQYGLGTLGQLAGMNTAQYQTGAQVGTTLLGQLAGMGTAQYQGQVQAGGNVLNNMTQMGLMIPNLQTQQYNNQLTGAQTQLQAQSLPQQMQMQQYLNYQNYILSLMGATPLPGQTPGGSATTAYNPGALNYAGTAALLGSVWPNG